MDPTLIAELVLDGLNSVPKLIALYAQAKAALSANDQATVEAAIANAKAACAIDVAQAVSDADAAAKA